MVTVRDLPGGSSLTSRPSVESNIGCPFWFSFVTVLVVYMAEIAKFQVLIKRFSILITFGELASIMARRNCGLYPVLAILNLIRLVVISLVDFVTVRRF